MALTFPLDLTDYLRRARSSSFLPLYTQSQAPTRGGGQQVVNLAPDLWQIDYSMAFGEADAKAFLALLQSLRGGLKPFRALDPTARRPRLYGGNWSPWNGAATMTAVGTQLDTITLAGLGSNLALSPGDLLSIAYADGTQSLHKVMEPVTANGIGEATITVEPTVRPGWPSTAGAVTFRDPWCKAIIDPGSLSTRWGLGRQCDINFKAVQVI